MVSKWGRMNLRGLGTEVMEVVLARMRLRIVSRAGWKSSGLVVSCRRSTNMVSSSLSCLSSSESSALAAARAFCSGMAERGECELEKVFEGY